MFSTTTRFIAAAAFLLPLVSAVSYSCNTRTMQCCTKASEASNIAGSTIISVAHVDADGVKGLVTSSCSPITVVGTGSGSSCTSMPVCCTENNINGLISFGCSAWISMFR
ncbi:fungal hydrophobin-domain-containing protein [Infundibulicybe gibba]|nr:fungal hydrophobin-domain-containing protein [Infundibulicybe gibba]